MSGSAENSLPQVRHAQAEHTQTRHTPAGLHDIGGDSSLTDSSMSTSWVNSTRQFVWIDRNGLSGTHRHRVTSDTSHVLLNLFIFWLLTAVASLNLVPVFGITVWLSVGLTATLAGGLVASLPALVRGWAGGVSVQILALVILQFMAGPVICLPGTTVARVIPSLSTLAQGAIDSVTSFKYVISVEPPLGFDSDGAMALWTLGLWASFLSITFANVKPRLMDAAAILVVLLELGTAIALGTRSGFMPLVSGALIAVVGLLWASWHADLLNTRASLVGTLLLIVSLIAALGTGTAIPMHRTVLRDIYEPPLDPYSYTSPLTQLRAYIKNHKTEPLLTVTGLPEKTPVRLAVMDSFDGVVWNLSDSTQAGSASYARSGTTLEPKGHSGEKPFTAHFSVRKGLSQVWFPLAGHPRSTNLNASSSARSPNSQSTSALYFNSSTDTALLPSKTTPGMDYTVKGTLERTPSDKQIRRAAGESADLPKATNVPKKISDLAQAWAGSDEASGASALKIAKQLRTNGWFSHGLQGDFPSSPGHGNYRLSQLVGGSSMVGDSEQYASAMALMARQVGLSSRVVLGFIPKDKAGNPSAERTEERNGTTSVTFTGNDIEAWVEVNLKGYGWVSFYPTPEETKVPDKNQDITPPDPQTLVRQPSVPLKDPIREERSATGTSLDGTPDSQTSASPLIQILDVLAKVGLYGSPLWLLLLVLGTLLGTKAVVKRRWRRSGSPSERISKGWDYLGLVANWSGAKPSGTRRQQAAGIEEGLGLDSDSLSQLCATADFASFAPLSSVDAGMSEKSAREYWRQIDTAERTALASLPLLKRWRAKLSLKGFGWLRTMGERATSVRDAGVVWIRKLLTHSRQKGTQ